MVGQEPQRFQLVVAKEVGFLAFGVKRTAARSGEAATRILR